MVNENSINLDGSSCSSGAGDTWFLRMWSTVQQSDCPAPLDILDLPGAFPKQIAHFHGLPFSKTAHLTS